MKPIGTDRVLQLALADLDIVGALVCNHFIEHGIHFLRRKVIPPLNLIEQFSRFLVLSFLKIEFKTSAFYLAASQREAK